MGRSRLVQALLGLSALALAVHAAHAVFGLGPPSPWEAVDTYLFIATIALAGLLCLLRAWRITSERGAWIAFGMGLLLYAAAEAYWSAALRFEADPPVPSAADVLWLAFYPVAYVGAVLLVRSNLVRFRQSLWLDGLIGALAVSALGVVLFGGLLGAGDGDTAETAVNLAYPLADLLLAAVVVALLALAGWAPARAGGLVALSLLVMAAADGVYLQQSANETYAEGGALDFVWLAAAVLLGWAAWQPMSGGRTRADSVRLLAAPVGFGCVAVGVLVYSGLTRTSTLAVSLAAAALLGVLVRLLLTFRENLVLLAASRAQADVDPLTGLANRRALQRDLERRFEVRDRDALLVLLDLNGFKAYNDAFGHLAGDTMLVRMAAKVSEAARSGRAYRLGGDEFCVLVEEPGVKAEKLAARIAAHVQQDDQHFALDASFGHAIVPAEVGDPSEALRLADERLYRDKGRRQPPARSVLSGVPLGRGISQPLDPAIEAALREALRD